MATLTLIFLYHVETPLAMEVSTMNEYRTKSFKRVAHSFTIQTSSKLCGDAPRGKHPHVFEQQEFSEYLTEISPSVKLKSEREREGEGEITSEWWVAK